MWSESPERLLDGHSTAETVDLRRPPTAGLMMSGTYSCRVCLERDGAESTSVVEHRCTDERTGKGFTANVCARCLKAGRETRVTCRTFGRPIDRRSLFADASGPLDLSRSTS